MSDPSSYRERTRIRVNGLLVRGDALLLVKVLSPVIDKPVWIPPGGGLEYGESMEVCLAREFKEETGLEVDPGMLRHINELVSPPYHAVEFYFEVKETGGKLQLGTDPEHSAERQILQDARFIPFGDFPDFDIVPEYVRSRFVKEISSGNRGISFSRNG